MELWSIDIGDTVVCDYCNEDYTASDETGGLIIDGYREASYVSKELDITPQELQFIEKYHVAYLTPKARGIAKAPRPPFFIPKEPPKVVAPQPKSSKPRWFTRTSYQ